MSSSNSVSSQNRKLETYSYDDQIVRMFTIATIVWGLVALFLGMTIAYQLANWKLNFGLSWFTFGRLRPLHTNAAIFAFVGNSMFAGIYYSTQRLLKTRLFNDFLSRFHFWGWQLIILGAALTLPFGITTSKEYAELEWPLDIAVVIIWVTFAVNFFGTIVRRRERHIYVAIWFYISTIVTVALLYLVNNLEIPVSMTKSYSIFSGAQDAIVQWWYGHNAVAFFLTTPFLGLMYYFVPKAANRPVYSYRLSIIHFWSLVFIYIWAGPHHLLYTALPEWAQTMGMAMSVSLWAPSWGGMINGLLTLRGVWDKVRSDPALKMMALAITFYGMSTFEGPMMAIKSVNMISHYTDWTVGHVHSGTIGWNYMLTAGILFYLVRKLWNTEIYSIKLGNIQFWLATIGLVLYITGMWAAGITQSLMWRAMDASGKLVYPNFIETVVKIVPMYWVRATGGLLVFTSFVIMAYNLFKTMKQGHIKDETFEAYALDDSSVEKNATPHRKIEGLPTIFTILSLCAILVGTGIELIPAIFSKQYISKIDGIKPYTPLEQAGRDIFTREGCYVCHSQMIRPMVHEVLRYGKPSEAGESLFDHPFQWGSKRTGPDLARVGGKYPNMWHYRHMWDPREVTPGSIMPVYTWLFSSKIDFDSLPKKLSALQKVGVPYSEEEINNSIANAKEQAQVITDDLVKSNVPAAIIDKEIIALIAYLQRLGKDFSAISAEAK